MRLSGALSSTQLLLKGALVALLALSYVLRLLSSHPLLLASAALLLLHHLSRRPLPTLLLDFSSHLPPPDRKLSLHLSQDFVRRSNRFSAPSQDFMLSIFLKSGLGLETYGPPFLFQEGDRPSSADLDSTLLEAREGIFGCVDSLLTKSAVHPSLFDYVIVTCGSFSPAPSLSSLVVNRYSLRPDVKTYNLSGMGCSSGVLAIDLAATLLRSSSSSSSWWGKKKMVGYALVVITENISLNWYFGDDRSMLVTNCIFRVGCAAAIVTNDPSRRPHAKFELIHSLRTHHGADDRAYKYTTPLPPSLPNIIKYTCKTYTWNTGAVEER